MSDGDAIDVALLRAALRLPSLVTDLAVAAPEAAPARVVLPVLPGPRARLLVVERARMLADHGGELGFPGGKPDAADADLAATHQRRLAASDSAAAVPCEVRGMHFS